MRSSELRVVQRDWSKLRQAVSISFRSECAPETGCIGILGEVGTNDRFLLAEMVWPTDGDFKVAEHGELVFDAGYIRRAHLLMRKNGLSGLAFFHTHPMATTRVSFSPYDDHQEPLLVENLQDIVPSTKVVSVVLGRESQCGRLWLSSRSSSPMSELVIVGNELRSYPLDGCSAPCPAPVGAVFDRAKTVTAADAMSLLSRMRIAVVGASGTGSLICNLLACAGCRHLLVLDPDILGPENRPRMLFQRPEDVGRPKVDIVERGLESLGFEIDVRAYQESILDAASLGRLRTMDLVFGCVDRGLPRYLLSQLSHQFLLPYVDVGSEIGADSKGIVSLDSRVSYVSPERPCLMCTGVVSARELHFESISADERGRVAQQGYSDDLVLAQPAVMDLNMRAASAGMLVLRHLLQPFLLEPLPLAITESFIVYSSRAIRKARVGNDKCRVCGQNSSRGYGDRGPTLGFSANIASALAEEHVWRG